MKARVSRREAAQGEEGRKPPFTKEAMFGELRQIMLIYAGHIELIRGQEAAIAFIGFASASDDDFPYTEDSPDRVNLELFDSGSSSGVKWLFDIAYDYAFQVGNYREYEYIADQRLISFRDGVPAADVHGGVNPYDLENSLCRHVAEMAQSRFHLAHYQGSPSVRELALLSGMTEAAVRNSLSSEGIKMEDFGGKRKISNEAAHRWLYGRRGFIPTREEDQKEFWKSYSLGLFERGLSPGLRQILKEFPQTAGKGLSPKEFAERAGVPEKMVSDVLEGTPPLDVDVLRRIAEALETDVPYFVSRAIEQALFAEMQAKERGTG
jgi:plasmid maintenance system antidote protein VapI